MKYLTFGSQNQTEFDIAILVPRLSSSEISKWYIDPYLSKNRDRVIAYDLYKEAKRTPVATQKEYLEELLPTLMDLKVKYLVVCDGEYFKTLTKKGTVESSSGYILDCIVGDFKVIYCPNFSAIFYDPDKVKYKIDQSLTALVDHMDGSYTDPGDSIIKKAAYPTSLKDIEAWLQRLLDMKVPLTCDIEGFSLKHFDSGLGSITFCWNQHEGISFPIDFREPTGPLLPGHNWERWRNEEVRGLLKNFFRKFKQKMIWHNITFDVYVLVYQLFMDHILDTEGMLDGLEVLLANYDDTKLITYLATNSCAGNKLGLKPQAQEYAGNYAVEDIKDICKVPMSKLLEYNLVDGLSTWYVYNKHYSTMIADQQQQIYEGLFKDAVVDIIQMQLTGLPVDMDEVKKVKIELQADADDSTKRMLSSNTVHSFVYEMETQALANHNKKLKTKTVNRSHLGSIKALQVDFNPNSAPQLQKLLYEPDFMGFPVLDLTDSNLPSTGKETLEKLKNHTTNPDELAFLEALIDYKDVAIILSTFIPAFLAAPLAPDGWHYLFGNFNLGGTLSGRLSSNNPNLQNIPSSGTKYAKHIKRCVKAPKGFLFVGLDFSSLEDRISALTTKDPNKLKVYTDGYDGHSLRAYFYFSTLMPDIIDTVESINSIQKKYKPLRQESKAPTFALTYQGTFITLMANCGFTEAKAKDIEAKYHAAYKVSDDWVAGKLEEASKRGYVTCAFGLRVRTPLLHQVILNTKRTPFEAAAEGRTAGNALGQSWCLLNSRAASEFMKKVRSSKFRTKIRPCAHIHDAQYYLIPDDIEVLMYMNEHLVKAVEWQNDPEIYHKDVKLGGELSIFYPNWSTELVIPNKATETEIATLAEEHFNEYAEAA